MLKGSKRAKALDLVKIKQKLHYYSLLYVMMKNSEGFLRLLFVLFGTSRMKTSYIHMPNHFEVEIGQCKCTKLNSSVKAGFIFEYVMQNAFFCLKLQKIIHSSKMRHFPTFFLT